MYSHQSLHDALLLSDNSHVTSSNYDHPLKHSSYDVCKAASSVNSMMIGKPTKTKKDLLREIKATRDHLSTMDAHLQHQELTSPSAAAAAVQRPVAMVITPWEDNQSISGGGDRQNIIELLADEK